MRETTSYTIGVAGAGKSYARCARFLHDEFLPLERGVHWSNFPVDVEALASALDGKHDLTADAVRERVRVIPEEVLKLWRDGVSGPWEYFETTDIQGAHIAIDEAHTVIGTKHRADHKKKWQEFCGELRHRGATIEFLTQAEIKLAAEIKSEAGAKLVIINSESRRDPFFRIQLGDWYQLRAKFLTGEYRVAVWQREYRFTGGKVMTVEDERSWPRDPYYFDFYDSYSAPSSGGLKAEAQRKEWQFLSRLGLLGWFFRKNWFHLVPRLAVLCLAVWVCFGGGGVFLFNQLQAAVVQSATEGKPAEGAAAGPGGELHTRGGVEFNTHPVVADVGEEQRYQVEAAQRDVAELKARLELMEMEARDRQRILHNANVIVTELREAVERGYWLVGIVNGQVAVFRDGSRMRAGEVFSRGRYEGRIVDRIDAERGEVVLADGLVFRLGDRTDDDFDRLQKLWEQSGAASVLAGESAAPSNDSAGTAGARPEWQPVRQRGAGSADVNSGGGPAPLRVPASGGE